MELPGIAATIALVLAAWLALAVIVALPLGLMIRRRNAQKPASLDFDALAAQSSESENASPRA